MAFKLGDTYICTESNVDWWTEGKEYEVQLNMASRPCIVDNDGAAWYSHSYDMTAKFKLKEEKEMKFKVFDLNNLTTSELREYVDLLEEKENAEFLLECFIEKVSK